MSKIILFTNQSANGNSGTGLWNGRQAEGQFIAYGTWDGATAKLQASPDDGTTWYDVSGVSLSDNGAVKFKASYNERLRANLAGVGTSSVTVELNELR